MTRSAVLICGFAALVIGLLVYLWRSSIDSVAPPARPVRAALDAGVASPPPPRPTAPVELATPAHHPIEALPPDLETVDPCTSITEPDVPEGYDTVVYEGITVAWQPGTPLLGAYDTPLHPLEIAHIASALLEEAAGATGTPARSSLTVIVFPTVDDFHRLGKGPPWASGLYNGAVLLPADPNGDLGVSLASLRHEIMHGQLHFSVGCMPVWFNEGTAMLFAGELPLRQWMEMLHDHDWLDVGVLGVPGVQAVNSNKIDTVYAQSLAMVVAAIEHVDTHDLPGVVRAIRAGGDDQPARVRAWMTSFANLDARAIEDGLARRVFGMTPGHELDAAIQGPLCCVGLRSPRAIACRVAVPPADLDSRRFWIDRSTTPYATCSTRWVRRSHDGSHDGSAAAP